MPRPALPLLHHGLRLCLGLAFLATPAWAGENRIDLVRPDAPELAAFGKQPIGVRTLQFVNPRQQDILKAKAGEPIPLYDRPLTVEVWYPAAAPANAPATPPGGLAPGEFKSDHTFWKGFQRRNAAGLRLEFKKP